MNQQNDWEQKTISELIALLDDTDEWNVVSAARVLGEKGCHEAVPALISLLTATELIAKYETFCASVRRRTKPGLGGLMMTQFCDDIELLRTAAARALGMIGNVQAIPALIDALHDSHRTAIPSAAALALTQIGTSEALVAVQDWQAKQPSA